LELLKIHHDTKGLLGAIVIIITATRHVETVIMMTSCGFEGNK